MAALQAEKPPDLLALGGDLLEIDIDCIQQQNDLDPMVGRLTGSCRSDGSVDGLKGENLGRQAVIEKREVLEIEAGNGLSRLVGHHNIELDAAFHHVGRRCLSRGRRFILRRSSRWNGDLQPESKGRQGKKQQQTDTVRHTYIIHLIATTTRFSGNNPTRSSAWSLTAIAGFCAQIILCFILLK